jgi:hypothetical protein
MTDRKFTPPTTFPAEYVTGDGCKAVILGETPDKDHPYVGWYERAESAELKLAKAIEERDEALNQLDSARYSVDILLKRVSSLLKRVANLSHD